MANFLSASRIVAGIALLVAAGLGMPRLVLVLLAYALLSDAIDGRVARASGTVSERGARLDSIADSVIYLTMPFVAFLLFPWLRTTETVWGVLVLLGYAVPITYGFAKFHRLTSYHTTLARVASVVLSISFFVLLATHIAWPFHGATVILLLSALEEISITWTLPAWRADVGSIWAVRRDAYSGERIPRAIPEPPPLDATPDPYP
jgi:CDP-diacylglycerol--glycerol-3-phosphate 3-phosphatidyltransferase